MATAPSATRGAAPRPLPILARRWRPMPTTPAGHPPSFIVGHRAAAALRDLAAWGYDRHSGWWSGGGREAAVVAVFCSPLGWPIEGIPVATKERTVGRRQLFIGCAVDRVVCLFHSGGAR